MAVKNASVFLLLISSMISPHCSLNLYTDGVADIFGNGITISAVSVAVGRKRLYKQRPVALL